MLRGHGVGCKVRYAGKATSATLVLTSSFPALPLSRWFWRRPAALLLVALLPLLVACSGEPSEKEMQGMVEGHTRAVLNSQGQGAFPGFANFRKQGCVVPKTSGTTDGNAELFDCYYSATFAATAARPSVTVNGKGRFTSTGNGFRYQDLGAQPR